MKWWKRFRIVPMIAFYEVIFQRRFSHCMRHLIFHPVSVLNLGVCFFSACLQTQPFEKVNFLHRESQQKYSNRPATWKCSQPLGCWAFEPRCWGRKWIIPTPGSKSISFICRLLWSMYELCLYRFRLSRVSMWIMTLVSMYLCNLSI